MISILKLKLSTTDGKVFALFVNLPPAFDRVDVIHCSRSKKNVACPQIQEFYSGVEWQKLYLENLKRNGVKQSRVHYNLPCFLILFTMYWMVLFIIVKNSC